MRLIAFISVLVVLFVFLTKPVTGQAVVLFHNERAHSVGPDAAPPGRNTRIITNQEGSAAGVSWSGNDITLSVAGSYYVSIIAQIDTEPLAHRIILHDAVNDIDLVVGPGYQAPTPATIDTIITVPVLGSVTFNVVHEYIGSLSAYLGYTNTYDEPGMTIPTNDQYMTIKVQIL